eukprot:ctg_288.g143
MGDAVSLTHSLELGRGSKGTVGSALRGGRRRAAVARAFGSGGVPSEVPAGVLWCAFRDAVDVDRLVRAAHPAVRALPRAVVGVVEAAPETVVAGGVRLAGGATVASLGNGFGAAMAVVGGATAVEQRRRRSVVSALGGLFLGDGIGAGVARAAGGLPGGGVSGAVGESGGATASTAA